MATSAFKSATKRTPIANSSTSANDSSASRGRTTSAHHRRSRSLSRFSRPLTDFSDEKPAPTGRFVNTVRGSGFPEISLDDIAIKLFSSGERGRSASRNDDVSSADKVNTSQRRGRSVSRHGLRGDATAGGGGGGGSGYGGGKGNSESNSRRRRSVSVARYQMSDSESDLDHSQNLINGASLKSFPCGNQTAASNHRQGLRRSLSQKDLKYHDDYSSHSSVLTDDEGRDAHFNKNGIERTIRTVYSQKKAEHPIGDDINSSLYEAMRKELRHAVEEIKMELELGPMQRMHMVGRTDTSSLSSNDCLQSKNSDRHAVSSIRRNYATKLEQPAKRKQDLLAEIVAEDQHGRELSMIVKELRPDHSNTIVDKPSRARRRSNDRSRMSKSLTEEAEKYIEDFISNVEDTDISSLDGERSDTSSSLGGIAKVEFQRPAISKSIPVEMDGVVLPWLQWETSNDASPVLHINSVPKPTPKAHLWDAVQEETPSVSSCGNWSPVIVDCHSANGHEVTRNRFGDLESYNSQSSSTETRMFDIDEYLKHQSDEEFLLERWRQQQRIHSGSLLLCNRMFF